MISLEDFSYSHYFFVYLPLALVLIGNTTLKENKKLNILVNFLVLISGIAILVYKDRYDFFTISHSIIGIIFVLLFIHLHRLRIFFVTMAIISGVVTHYGPKYFIHTNLAKDPEFKNIIKDDQWSFYKKKINPIIQSKCIQCHNESTSMGAVNLSTFRGLYQVGSAFPIIYPKHEFQSLLLLSVQRDPGLSNHMPKFKGFLTDEEINNIRTWIHKGAFNFTNTETLFSESHKLDKKYQNHWTENTQLPSSSDIDSLYLKILRENKVNYEIKKRPSFEIKKKMSLLSTGFLPEYFAGKNINIDNLLSTIEYSQYFTSLWLDFTAFSDSIGGDDNASIKGSAKYKYWVRKSFSKDVNYLEFLSKQIEIQNKSYSNLPYMSIYKYQYYSKEDKIDVSHQAMQKLFQFSSGTNLKCAQCHNHKFTLVSNEDYYSQLKIFSKVFLEKEYPPKDSDFDHRVLKNKPLIERTISLYNIPSRKGVAMSKYITDPKDGIGFFTARNYVDYIWKNILGKSFISDNSDHHQSSLNPKLLPVLNLLTNKFIENNGSTKYLVKTLMSSKLFTHKLLLKDNRDFKLTKSQFIKAEVIRDNLLSLSNLINKKDNQFLTSKDHKLKKYLLDSLNGKRFKKSSLLRRDRSFSDSIFHNYFQIPTGNEVSYSRKLDLNYNNSFALLGESFFTPLLKALKDKFSLNGYNSNAIGNIYHQFYNRKPTQKELENWKMLFNDNTIKNKEIMLFRILLLSKEFLYI